MKALLLLPLFLVSCVAYEHVASSSVGNYERDRVFSVGGSSSQKGADGSSFVQDHNGSFHDFTSAVTALAGAYITGNVLKAREVTSQLASQGASQLEIQKVQSAAAIEALRIKGQTGLAGQAIGAGTPVNPLTLNVP